MRPLFDLGPRLALCAGLVRPGRKLIDVGTDHAYLPIWLLRRGLVKSALATDINPGPLEAARRSGEKYGAGEALSLRLCDGLAGVAPEEGEDIVIAGMGGELILRIVGETPWLRDGEKRLVLQPMSSVPELRLGLRALGFAVLEEHAAVDGGKVYSAFAARYVGEPPKTGPLYPWLGKLVPGEPGAERYAEKVLRELANRLQGARHSGAQARAAELEARMAAIRDTYLPG